MTKLPALLLIDLQHDYLNAPGLEPHRGLITARTARLLKAARSWGVPIIHAWTTVSRDRDNRMPHWKADGTWWCVENTEGHRTPDLLRPVPGETIVHKTFFSAFSSGSLDQALKSIDPGVLVLAGVHLHACLRATALDAYQRGFETWIAQDATGSNDPMHASITRRYLEARGFRFPSVKTLVEGFSTRGAAPQPGEESVLLASPASPGKTWTVPVSSAHEIAETIRRARLASPALRSMPPDERA